MHRSRTRLATWIPAVIGIVALVALAVLPLIMNARTNRLRDEIESTAQPARRFLNAVNYQLSVQISSLTRAAVTGDREYLDDYREASVERKAAMDALAGEIALMDPPVAARYSELKLHIERWEAAVAGRDEGAAAARESRYADVIQDLGNLDDAMTDFENRLSGEVQRLVRLETSLSIGLVVLALIAAVNVVWLQTRLRNVLVREQEARRAAENLVRARDEILGIVSHDLRGPLTAISLSAQMLEDGELVDTIRTSSRRMDRLIQDLLDAAKAEASTLSIRHEAVDPADVVREVVKGHALIAAEKKIGLREEISEGLPAINGDRDRLVQALTNLAGNALKFTPPGGTVRISVDGQKSDVVFAVEDTGAGIPETEMPHLFEPFWQAKKTAHLGAGLGLKIAKAIVEAHGGSIEVTNVPDGGARFAFVLPAG
jgi:signal transduction histidine kinase